MVIKKYQRQERTEDPSNIENGAFYENNYQL